MGSFSLQSAQNQVNECVSYIEAFLSNEIEDLQKQLANLKRLNLEVFSNHLHAQFELGVFKDKKELIKDIRCLIQD